MKIKELTTILIQGSKICRMAAVMAMFVILSSNLSAQKFYWDIDLEAVFDNREGSHDITPTETYFFTNLAPEVGLDFGHYGRIGGGVVWNQPIGNEWDGYKISPTLYYRYESQRWNFSMGMFPRRQLIQELPGFLWGDSLTYHQKNIRGALVQYRAGRSFAELYLDWRQMQTERKREAFNIVVHGQWQPQGKVLYIGGHAMMNHYALQKHAPADQHIVDNFLVNPYLGVDLSGKTALDSLNFRAGPLATIERNRALGGWAHAVGGWLEAIAEWRFLGLKNTLYAGQALLPSYAEFASALYPGDPFYQKKFYNRTDIYARVIRNKFVELDASLDFHVSPGSFIFYQRLLLRVYFSSL